MAHFRPLTRLGVESQWRARVQAAQQRYYEAAANYQQTVEERVRRLAPTQDGAFAVRQAARAEAAARREYLRVLQVFNELFQHGKEPKE